MAVNAQTATINNRKEFSFRLNSPLRTAVQALLVAVGAYIAAMFGHAIVLSSRGVSVLWPACAFLVSVMLLVPRRVWPVLIPAGLAGFVVHDLQFGFTPWTIARLLVADTLEILIVCLGLGYCFDGVPRLNSSKALAKYCFVAVLLGPFVSAFVVAIAVPGSYLLNWRIWFFSQMLAFLTLTPAILSWATANYGSGFRGSLQLKVEAAALIGGLAILGYFVLLAPWKIIPSALIYSFVPFFLWAALRFGSMGVSTSIIVISFLSIWGAVRGHGPFAGPESFHNVLSLQLFLIFAAIPFMVLAAMAEERGRDQKTLSNLSRKLIEAHEEERTWIARELHDDINQRIALLVVDLERLKQELPPSVDQAKHRIEGANERIRELGNDIQALSHRLHSSKLEHLGLVAASSGFCKELSRQHDVEIDFQSEDVPSKLPPEIALCLFRVLQEALQNAIKHSGVRKFEVSLKGMSKELQLGVFDSGVGFDPEQINDGHGLGLISMKERLRLIDGRLFIDSRPHGGTRIHASAPLSPQMKYAVIG
jgi:signal transduction histidine kinase